MSLSDTLRALGRPIVGAVAGRGQKADFLVVHNSSRFPGMLSGMLPLGDANAITLELGPEAIRSAKGTPVLAGICGADPMRSVDRLLDEVRAAGFAGVQNFPTVGLIDGIFRRSLEETELGYAREVELVRAANRAGLFTAPFVFTADEAGRMLEAGADVLVAHPGLAVEGGARRIEAVAAAARAARKDAIVLAFGADAGKLKGVQGLFVA
jgi:predicted TIM-barrel enzyme